MKYSVSLDWWKKKKVTWINSFQKLTIHLVITLIIPKALQNSSESDIHLTNSNNSNYHSLRTEVPNVSGYFLIYQLT